MPKICFIYTDTNGLHKTNDFVSTKNLYKFARLIAIHYMIGEYNNTSINTSIITNQRVVDIILKPKTIYFDKIQMIFRIPIFINFVVIWIITSICNFKH